MKPSSRRLHSSDEQRFGSVKGYALTPSQILPHHTADGLRRLDLHGVGGVRVGTQSEAGIETHLYFLPKDEPEERNRRPGGSFPLVNNLFAEHLMSCGAVILTVSYAPAPPHFRRFPPR